MEFATHMVLDVVGPIPVIGEPADLLNASIYLAEGNYLDASLSAAGAIPFAGWAASGAQIVKNTYRAANAAMEVADTVNDGIRLADNAPLSAATPPASTITTFDPIPPMVKMPDTPIALPKTPDIPMARSGAPDAGASSAGGPTVVPGGRLDGETVFAGHGYAVRDVDGEVGSFTVPEGTTVKVYVDDDQYLWDSDGFAVEMGGGTPVREYLPGESMPAYVLDAADESLTVASGSVRVDSPTPLSELLDEGMGTCHWAACTKHFDGPA